MLSQEITDEVWRGFPGCGNKLLLALILARWAGPDGTTRRSVAQLASEARIGSGHARKLLRELRETGTIEVVERGGGGRPDSATAYRIVRTQLDSMNGIDARTVRTDTPRVSQQTPPTVSRDTPGTGTPQLALIPGADHGQAGVLVNGRKLCGRGQVRLDLEGAIWHGITETDRHAWGRAYPAVDIDRQLAAMAVWCRANPAKGRKQNYQRFISNWLSAAQDRGGDLRGPGGGRSGQTPGAGTGVGLGGQWLAEQEASNAS